MKIALIPNMTRQNAPDVTKKVLKELEKLNVTVLLSENFVNDFKKTDYIKYCDIESSIKECDIVLTVGGDGTFIKSAKLSSENNKPLLCINAGKLAYLAGLESTELSLLKDVVKGEFKTEKRMMLDATIIDKNVSKHTIGITMQIAISQNRDKCRPFIFSTRHTITNMPSTKDNNKLIIAICIY